MRTKVSWGENADNMGFAQPHNIFNLFNNIVNNDDFTLTHTGVKKLVLEGSLAFEGFVLDLRMTLGGKGFTYQGDELTGGKLKEIKLQQLTDDGKIAKIFSMTDVGLQVPELIQALDFEDNGGDDGTVEALLYGKGWIYTGVDSVDLIDPAHMFFGFGTQFQMNGRDTIIAGRGHDTIIALAGNDYVEGGKGNDVIRGGLGKDVLKGGSGKDDIRGDDDYFRGGADEIFGGYGNDTIDAGPGNDTVNGGRGNDHMVDADGRDTFIFTGKSGHDWLHDTDNSGADLDIRTSKQIKVTFLNLEDEIASGPWQGEYFDRGYLVEWGKNSLLINTYADIADFGLTDYVLVG